MSVKHASVSVAAWCTSQYCASPQPWLMFQAVAAATDSVGAGEEQVLPHTPIGMPQVEQYMRKMQLQEQKEFLFWNTQPVPKISEWLLQLVYVFILMPQTECLDKM